MRSVVPGAGAAPLSGAILVAVPAMGTTVGAQRTPLPPSGEGLRIMTTMSGLLMGYPTPYGRGLGLPEIFGDGQHWHVHEMHLRNPALRPG